MVLVLVCMDDVFYRGRFGVVGKVLQLVAKTGLKLNLAKCIFLANSLEYLGHEVSAAGIRPGKQKAQAHSAADSLKPGINSQNRFV